MTETNKTSRPGKDVEMDDILASIGRIVSESDKARSDGTQADPLAALDDMMRSPATAATRKPDQDAPVWNELEALLATASTSLGAQKPRKAAPTPLAAAAAKPAKAKKEAPKPKLAPTPTNAVPTAPVAQMKSEPDEPSEDAPASIKADKFETAFSNLEASLAETAQSEADKLSRSGAVVSDATPEPEAAKEAPAAASAAATPPQTHKALLKVAQAMRDEAARQAEREESEPRSPVPPTKKFQEIIGWKPPQPIETAPSDDTETDTDADGGNEPSNTLPDPVLELTKALPDEASPLPAADDPVAEPLLLSPEDAIGHAAPHVTELSNRNEEGDDDAGTLHLRAIAGEDSARPASPLEEELLSRASHDAAALAFRALSDPQGEAAREVLAKARMRKAIDDGTLDQLTRETLRPLLARWLDEHLPGLVENLVLKEIEKARDDR
ncbi:MAG: DUF2497 domain-containing protein [Neomegalonema sp.]|nr:DUF2497 domain-containing protein [Neomegalonema sp.]